MSRPVSGGPFVLDLFAGPGGFDEGLRHAGFTGDLVGIEWDADACATARAAGHHRIRADVLDPDLHLYDFGPVDGLLAGPTCRPWSRAGNGDGHLDRSLVFGLLADHATGRRPQPRPWRDSRSGLTAEPMRWIRALRPTWVVLEQVPAVLPVWARYATHLADLGYDTWYGVLRAERYGVPSTRKRAVLVARRDGGPVEEPILTHAEPTTMGQALGVDDGRVLVSNYGNNGDPKTRGRRRLDQPAPTMTGKCCRNVWEWPDGTRRNLSLAEAAVLTGFRPDYPFTGGRISRQQQLGDAVPPPLAAAILRPLLVTAASERAA